MKTSKHLLYFFVFVLSHGIAWSQTKSWQESFSDSSWRTRQTWYGDSLKFENRSGKLFGNSSEVNDEFYLSMLYQNGSFDEWAIDIDLPFSTSSSNYVDVYFGSNSYNLRQANNALFARIGGVKDRIEVFEVVDGNEFSIIQSEDNITHQFMASLQLRKQTDGSWLLQYITEKDTNKLDGRITGFDPAEFAYSGILVRQSTASFHGKQSFDNWYIGPIRRDTIPPFLEQVTAENNVVEFVFDEAISNQKVDEIACLVTPSLGNILSKRVTKDTLQIAFGDSLKTGEYLFQLKNVEDVFGNRMRDTSLSLTYIRYEKAAYKDVVITEIFADPSPAIELPEVEYIELYNRSDKVIQLRDWVLTDKKDTNYLSEYTLWPKTYVVLCDTSLLGSFPVAKKLHVPGFISLNNSGDSLELYNSKKSLIDEAHYTSEWHTEEWKKDGGWSLERIDVQTACLVQGNWASSISNQGGTPGKPNSVAQLLGDVLPPVPTKVLVSTNQVSMYFDESIYYYTPNLLDFVVETNEVVSVAKSSNYQLQIDLKHALDTGNFYDLELNNICDCQKNILKDYRITIGISAKPTRRSILINEVMYDPSVEQSEFVELYNNSNQLLDLRDVYIGIKNDDGNLKILKQIATEGRMVLPGQYVAVSKEVVGVMIINDKVQAENCYEFSGMPSLTNDHGNIGIFDRYGNEIDWINYKDEMHNTLLNSTKGVSLERKVFDGVSDHYSNWTSASYVHHYATPGYKNSQQISQEILKSTYQILCDPISPDDDGYCDELVVQFEPNISDANVHLEVFDLHGRLQKSIVNSGISGVENTYLWNLQNENGELVPQGVYVVVLEAINEQNEKLYFKAPFTIIR